MLRKAYHEFLEAYNNRDEEYIVAEGEGDARATAERRI